ncbi:EcoRI family type II restriction endonuclease, partial [Escherichia coli]|uniref:EcoRI family type II restriction endonuclease n=1 Tax=Escherichia coli TaxID=562 RepID=UPI0024181AFD
MVIFLFTVSGGTLWYLGGTLFVSNSSIKPDGGIVEVKDDYGEWRVVLVAEAKHQGK